MTTHRTGRSWQAHGGDAPTAASRRAHRLRLITTAALLVVVIRTFSKPAKPLYSAERSIIDAVRLRHREGSDLAWQALRRWLAQPGASPAPLIELVQRFPYAEPALRQALAVLL